MNLDIWLYTSQLLDHTLVHKFTSINKKIREYFLSRLVQIIDYLLAKNGHKALPKWCYMKIPLGPIDPEEAQRIVNFKEKMFGQLPKEFNIKGGILGIGEAILFPLFRRYDVFVKDEEEKGRIKRIKAELDDKKLDFTFKDRDIELIDISVCQLGIHLVTNEVYVTPLFLFTFGKKVVVCRVPYERCLPGFLGSDYSPLYERFEQHVVLKHEEDFTQCAICDYITKTSEEEEKIVQKYFQRVNMIRQKLDKARFVFVE